MIHHATDYAPLGDHYAAGLSAAPAGYVLAQVQQDGNQARAVLTPREARHFAQLLVDRADAAEARSSAPMR